MMHVTVLPTYPTVPTHADLGVTMPTTGAPQTNDPTDTLMVAKQPLLLTLKEAGEALRLGRAKLYELMAAGELRSVKIGGARRIPVSALQEFVDRLEADERKLRDVG